MMRPCRWILPAAVTELAAAALTGCSSLRADRDAPSSGVSPRPASPVTAVKPTPKPRHSGSGWAAPGWAYTYLPGETPRVYVRGKVGGKATLAAYPVDIHRWLDGKFSTAEAKPVATVTVSLPRPKPGDRTPVIDEEAEKRRQEEMKRKGKVVGNPAGRQTEKAYVGASIAATLPPLRPGAYAVSIHDGTTANGKKEVLLLVSRLALTVRGIPDHALVRASRLDTGEAISDCTLTVREGSDERQEATDKDGTFQAETARAEPNPQFLAVRGDDIAFAYSQGVSSDYGYEGVDSRVLYFQTDRPLYRPGQKAEFKGVLRHRTPDGYEVIANEKVTAEVFGPDGNSLKKLELTTNENGALTGSLDLADDAALGSYRVQLHVAEMDDQQENFTVAKFRKPEYLASVKAVQPVVVDGETFTAEVSANYYFGAPVAGATARYEILARPDYWWWRSTDPEAAASDAAFPGVNEEDQPQFRSRYRYGRFRGYRGYEDYGPQIARGTVTLDKNGKARVSVPAKFAPQSRGYTWLSRLNYVVKVTVMDNSRQSVEASGTGAVVPSGIALTATQDKWGVSVGQPVTVNLRTAPAKTLQGLSRRVDVSVVRRRWHRVRVADSRVKGRSYVTYKEETTTVDTTTVTTGADGKGKYTFTPKRAGDYTITTVAKDTDGRKVRADANAWAYSPDDPDERETPDIAITPDKKRYYPGDTATLLLHTPAPTADLWVTAFGRKNVTEKRVVAKNGMATVSLPLDRADAPNVQVVVSYVKNKRLFSQQQTLLVSPRDSLLNVSVTPARTDYRPGETADYLVKTTDRQGKPVSADVALTIADASLYALVADDTEDVREFFWSPLYLPVAETFSYSELPVGEPQQGSLLRRDKWGNVEEDEYDRVRAKPKPSMAYRGDIGLADGNGAGFGRANFAVDREVGGSISLKSAAGPVGGGGGIGGGGEGPPIQIRTDFRDSAYWTPSVVTDGSGTATVKVPLPDNLTTWRTTARAISPATQVGSGSKEITTSLPLIARLATPRFATQGDHLTLSGIIHNYTERPVACAVTLTAEGAGIALEGSGGIRRVTLAPGEDKRIDWPAKGALPGMTRLTLTADGGAGAKDGMELPLSTLPYGATATVASSGVLPDKGIVKGFTLPVGSRFYKDDLQIMLAPSLLSVALGGAADLAEYPYGCIEQTLSKFVPDLYIERLLKERNAKHPKADELPKMAKKGLERVYALQLQDGGWGFGFETDPYFTGIAVEALLLAKECGYEVKASVLERGIAALQTSALNLRTTPDPRTKDKYWAKWEANWNLQRKARALYALSLVQPNVAQSPIATLWNRRADLETTGVALLVRAAQKTGQAEIVKEGIALLHKRANKGSVGVWWKVNEGYYIERDTLGTAEAVRALLAVDKNDPLIPGAFRYLIAQRQGKSWYTTNDTAAVLYAATDYERAFPAKKDALSGAKIIVNGKTVQTVRFTDRDIFQPETVVQLDPAILPSGGNEISVQPLDAGDNPVYYSLALRYFLPQPPGSTIEPIVAGIRVERTYLKRVPKKPLDKNNEDLYWSDANWDLVPFGGQAKPGDDVVVKLVVSSDSPVGYAVIEDFLPAGCEPADQIDAQAEGYGYRFGWWGGWGRRETHDERIAFLGERLEKGQTVLTYRLKVVTPGVFNAVPARAFAMYVPEIRGSAKNATLTVRE